MNRSLATLREAAASCRTCPLWQRATQTVFGEGSDGRASSWSASSPAAPRIRISKWEPRGKRRIHQKPNADEIAACRPWLESELAAIGPRVLVCLGATAAQALLGKTFRVTKERGKLIPSSLAPNVMATVHPSSVLRTPDEAREAMRAEFVKDLRAVARVIRGDATETTASR